MLSLFPIRASWSIEVKGIAGSPGFSTTRAYVPIDDGRLAAFDLVRGRTLWTITAPTTAAPVADEALVLLTMDMSLRALHAASGVDAWRAELEAPASTSLSLRAGWLLVPDETGGVAAFRASDGSRIWDRKIGSPASAPPTIDGVRVYVPTRDGRVLALGVTDGRPLWERRLGGAAEEILAVDGRLYVGSKDNYFYSLDAEHGGVRWRWRTGGDIVGAPVADQDRVYFVSLDNVVRALDLRSGAQRWRRALPNRPGAGPRLAAGSLLVWSLGGAVQALATKDGAHAGELERRGLLAGPLHVVEPPDVPLPAVVRVTRSLEGSAVTALVRDVEPKIVPLTPLPNPIPVAPSATSSPLPDPGGASAPSGGQPTATTDSTER